MANGRWLYFLGSDDLLLSGFNEMADQLRSPDMVYYRIPKQDYLQEKKAGFYFAYRKIQRI